MNLNHLAIFHAVAASGSVSRGAQQLHISQSAVSKQLSEFERALGVPLFDRLPRGVRLTEAGRLLVGYANRLFAIEAEARHALGDLKQHARGSITIGASRTIGSYLLPQRLAAFGQRHPAVAVSLQVENTQVIERTLLAGEIDIGFTEGVVSSALLDYAVFAQDELVLIASPRHPAARQGPIRIATLGEQRLLMHEVGSGTRAVTELALAEKGVRLRPSMTLASTEAIKHTVAAGAGLAFLSSLSIRTELKARRLTVLAVEDLHIARDLYVVRLRDTPPGPTLAAFLAVLDAAG